MLVLQTLPIRNPHIGAIGVRPVFSEAEIERVKTSAGAGWEAGTIGAVGASQKVGFVNKAAVRQMTQQQLKVERDGFPINKIAAEVANFNSMAWRFQLCGFVDDDMPWLMRYTAPGDHYDWHVDVGHAANGSRKLGFTVQLAPGRIRWRRPRVLERALRPCRGAGQGSARRLPGVLRAPGNGRHQGNAPRAGRLDPRRQLRLNPSRAAAIALG